MQQLHEEAKHAEERGRHCPAIAKYEDIVQIAPKLATAYNNLGALYFASETFQRRPARCNRV